MAEYVISLIYRIADLAAGADEKYTNLELTALKIDAIFIAINHSRMLGKIGLNSCLSQQ
jgi:hypothetical protein